MTEAITQNEAYLRAQEEGYATYAIPLAHELRSRARSVVFGPTYKTVTRKGKPLIMRTYQIPSGVDRRIDVVIAFDDEGSVVGHKLLVLDESEDRIEANNGAVYVAKRGEGIAKPIVLTSFHLLQQEADSKQKDIYYYGINRNGENFRNVLETIEREQRGGLPLTHDPAVVPYLLEESQRWHSLFGPNGSLGFDPLLRKTFSHNGPVDPIDPSSTIELTTEETVVRERRLTLPRVISAEPNPTETIDMKRAFLMEQVIPKLEAMAA